MFWLFLLLPRSPQCLRSVLLCIITSWSSLWSLWSLHDSQDHNHNDHDHQNVDHHHIHTMLPPQWLRSLLLCIIRSPRPRPHRENFTGFPSGKWTNVLLVSMVCFFYTDWIISQAFAPNQVVMLDIQNIEDVFFRELEFTGALFWISLESEVSFLARWRPLKIHPL